MKQGFRKTGQHLLPVDKPPLLSGVYDIYPAYELPENQICIGFDQLTNEISGHHVVCIDGYSGVLFDSFRKKLEAALIHKGIVSQWIDVSSLLKSESEINQLVEPFLGGDDPLFGTRTNLVLSDFFDQQKVKTLKQVAEQSLSIYYGTGAFLFAADGFKVYIDLPKNEVQFRSRAGSITNLGTNNPDDAKKMYKRFYFVDWVVLNEHKKQWVNNIDIFIDGQNPELPTFITGKNLLEALHLLSCNVFRVRPWFEPGTWGGQWIRNKINGLNKDVPNYAWSFELIVPENGLLFRSSGKLLEVSFDCLMFTDAEAVLGDCHSVYGSEFPIRFDFLDTFEGGNLSVQCHPQKEYIRSHFGENFTQEEAYYILDSQNKAHVYLGFQENIDPEGFKTALENSFKNSEPIDIVKYVQKHDAAKHDFFLIPPGTIHASGADNLVLEISSTPYIFTFKMYDWLRPDLDGRPRPLNIRRGMENLIFDRKGEKVKEELIAKPKLINEGAGWKLFHLATHKAHLYDVHRIHLQSVITIDTEDKCHVLSLVEGRQITIITSGGMHQQFNYAETFVIPAACKQYQIVNTEKEEVILIKAFVK